eukprot:NODE_3872_length_881_cov_25.774536_g3719_i0.p1 GENE.NODE_3872_length_881_cov_25.774536_g3719_i0~~NODE_3872_length_881_cov_25.774536_g3719_i0.p1  ORF type:complete len:264 (+),score=79.16 NODE_3872_length_881_cov_25.774536_g3719_i0:38-793(+)
MSDVTVSTPDALSPEVAALQQLLALRSDQLKALTLHRHAEICELNRKIHLLIAEGRNTIIRTLEVHGSLEHKERQCSLLELRIKTLEAELQEAQHRMDVMRADLDATHEQNAAWHHQLAVAQQAANALVHQIGERELGLSRLTTSLRAHLKTVFGCSSYIPDSDPLLQLHLLIEHLPSFALQPKGSTAEVATELGARHHAVVDTSTQTVILEDSQVRDHRFGPTHGIPAELDRLAGHAIRHIALHLAEHRP